SLMLLFHRLSIVIAYTTLFRSPGRPGAACRKPNRYASSSIGRAAVSKTAGWGFESLLACQPRHRRHPAPQATSEPMNSKVEQHRSEEHTSELQSRENDVCRLQL